MLAECGIEIDSDTYTHFLCLCPFHSNTDSPAFAVDKTGGMFYCFNPACQNAGTLVELVRRVKHVNPFKAERIILKAKHAEISDFASRFTKAMESKQEFPSMSVEKVESLHSALWTSPALDYMRGRGFEDDTLEFFKIGFSEKRVYPPPYKSRPDMVVVPMHDIDGNPIGVVGRSLEGKVFKNSAGLPKSQTAWNIHRAKRHGQAVVVCESTFDAMRIHQAGYPNVIALLGGHASESILEQINRHFSVVINMTDFDKKQYHPNCRACRGVHFAPGETPCLGHRPGRDLGREIVNALPNKRVLWAAFDDSCVYPHGAKDASDMTDDEIRQCLRNAVSNLAYTQWSIENSVAA